MKPVYFKILFLVLLFLFLVPFIFAAGDLKAQPPAPGHFEVEADPIAFSLNGYSIHAGYQYKHIRFDAGMFAIDEPSFFMDNRHFNDRSSGFGLKMDYIMNREKGIIFGVQADYDTDKLRLKSDGLSSSNSGVTAGIRTGYRIMFGKRQNEYKGLYLMPWIAFLYSPAARTVVLRNETYKEPKFSPFPTVHIGYRF